MKSERSNYYIALMLQRETRYRFCMYIYMRVNNGNWQFTKTFCPGIKKKLSGEPRLQGRKERRGMIRVVIFRAASTMVDIFTASLHDTKLEITLQLEISRVTCITYSIIFTCTPRGNEIFTRVAPHCVHRRTKKFIRIAWKKRLILIPDKFFLCGFFFFVNDESKWMSSEE